ncbi:MAG: hypothetical protein CSA70_12175 [Rhodobacterales bacterium]|nr:MAG: hypothetical protein CSA70_12175 [Rhodobacterales bacterium]
MTTSHLTCRCGQVHLTVEGPHIATVECLCDSCRAAAQTLEKMPEAEPVLDEKDATLFVMHRKDRVTVTAGKDMLKSFRLSEDSGTRRVVASCCNTPIFLELKGGHWLSIYGALWPENKRPALEMRTMVGSRDDLPNDVPNLKTHSLGFYGRLFGAWIKMGFKTPKVEVNGEWHV